MGVTGIERDSLDEFLGQEVMPADLKVAADLRRDAKAGKPPQRVVLLTEPGDRVRAVGRQARVRPGLLQDHSLRGPLVVSGVDATPVGEVECAIDAVGKSLDGHRLAGGEVRREEAREADPGRYREHGRPQVGHQFAGRVRDRGHQFATRIEAMPFGKAAVTHIERPCTVSQVAQNIGTRGAVKLFVKVAEDKLECGLV